MCCVLLQDFLENLDPWQGKDDNELIEHLFELSLQIEPRNVRPPPKFVSTTVLCLLCI